MVDTFRNLIGGEWVAGATVSANRNPSNVSDVIGEYAQADTEQTRAAIAAAKAAFPAWATGSLQERANILDRAGARSSPADSRPAPVARRGQDAPEGIGEAARAGHLQVLRGRCSV
jgi:aldehyde dehydrogenase (NAD+)